MINPPHICTQYVIFQNLHGNKSFHILQPKRGGDSGKSADMSLTSRD